jgi:glycosyltransferase involved in cell wall biosynthesis
MIRVSVGVPVYNGGRYLEEALEQLVAQTFGDIEILISDNGSTDATEDICRSFAGRDNRIRYIRHAQTSEASVNFTYLVREARAPYFMWAANDDRRSLNFVEALHTALERNARAVCAQGECVFIDATGQIMRRGMPNPQMASDSRVTRVSHVMRAGPADRFNNMFTYGLHRTDMLRRFGIGRILLARASESHYSELPLLFSLSAAGHLVAVADAQFYYRFHSEQTGQVHVPVRDALRLELGLVVSLPGAVWAGARSPLACLAAVSVVSAGRAKYLAGLANAVLRGANRGPVA